MEMALSAMGSEELRAVIVSILLELDDRAADRVAQMILHRGGRAGSGGSSAPADDADVTEAIAFAQAAQRSGYANPEDVDLRLRRGIAAFARKDYFAAQRIFGALLGPIAEAEIDLGQDELVDEVLTVNVADCATQYVVAEYMLSEPGRRAEKVRAAVGAICGIGTLGDLIQAMERVAIEALPGLSDFYPAWRAIIEKETDTSAQSSWDGEANRGLREVILRMEGVSGLAALARSTRRIRDLDAWCACLVEARDWKASLAAFEEASVLVGEGHRRAPFLDGAALAAQGMGIPDLSPWLEQAWNAQPTMFRLSRWLGSATSRPLLLERAARALQACPDHATRQRAFLHLIQGQIEQTAELLSGAPGLGWSHEDHPGHLIFPLFVTLLGGTGRSDQAMALPDDGMKESGFATLRVDGQTRPVLATPDVAEIVRDAGVEGLADNWVRQAMLTAMRQAASKRVSAVTEATRRNRYGHAASLVATCVACDPSAETLQWAASLRERNRRFSALSAEFDARMGKRTQHRPRG